MLTLPISSSYEDLAQETIVQTTQKIESEINPDQESSMTEEHTNGLIADLAWILLLGAIVTLLFKKLKQPVVLGYILAGFLASPKFTYLPSISNLENITFWADLGIVVLMFSIGLEFSFKKLMNSGSSAVVTALIIISGMTFAGFGVGKILGLNSINCIFLGGMISMSSTTIIMKSLDDLGLKQKKFASLVLSVLIIEDLFAVLMLVLLSSLAMGDVKGMELLMSIAKLAFFLIIWFLVGVYLLPTFLTKSREYLNDETLLVVAMGLCFSMAIFSVVCGFSLELGAFVMGSILAGTVLAERMEKVIGPIKNLFGAVFFISVGMMVDPSVLVTYWWQILILAVVVIVGMIIFGTLGMLVTGQNLKVAMESGFTLTQVGEFSFIIASLGMSLGVLNPSLYPIIVAVSVLTIFTTPYFITMADGAYGIVERHLPKGLNFLISRYSKQVTDSNETKQLWRAILKRYLWRIILYSVILLAEILVSQEFLFPILEKHFENFGHLAATIITIVAMAPFLFAMSFSTTEPDERIKLHQTASFYDVPLVAMRIIRYLITLFFIVYFCTLAYSTLIGWLVGLGCFILVMVFASTKITARYRNMETRFMDNLNIRENTRLGINNNLVDDLHQAYIEVGPSSPFVGDKLRDSGLRRDYGVSVSSIQRGEDYMPLPSAEARIFPGDILGVIGTDDQLKALNEDIECWRKSATAPAPQPKMELSSITLTPKSPIIGVPLGETNIQKDYYSMIVKIQRGEDEFIQPTPDVVLEPGDTIWVVGDPSQFNRMKA
ncbi:MAG: sodium:proton antiporter [Bacteroides sp.]|nr:sodium:proton antiporter [Bacteroides sp.]MDE7442320.1 cation:proton antiporter [Muribaculaceae bacterium]